MASLQQPHLQLALRLAHPDGKGIDNVNVELNEGTFCLLVFVLVEASVLMWLLLHRGFEDAHLAAREREPDSAHCELRGCIMKTVYSFAICASFIDS